MKDEQIRDYLRARGHTEPPADLVESVIQSVATIPWSGRSWIARLMPAATVTVAAVTLATAVLLSNQNPNLSVPDASRSHASSASANPSPSPTPPASPSAEPSVVAEVIGDRLVRPGDIVEMPAIDNEGEWGTIRLERGDEIIIDPESSTYEQGSMLIEIRVSYAAERRTNQPFGGLDWGLRVQHEVPEVVDLWIVPATSNPARPTTESLQHEVATLESSATAGWIALEVPIVDITPAVYITYQGGERPGGATSAPAWEVLVRERDRNAPPTIGAPLLRAGDATLLSAVAQDGSFGTITIDRGLDTGGYPLVPEPSSGTHFFIELLATYELDRAPTDTPWGDLDWRLESADGLVRGQYIDGFPPPRGRGSLGQWPGATVPEARYEGWLIFAIPREAADVKLELVYQPPGMGDIARIPVRMPGVVPGPVAAEWPRPDPVYVAQDGLPFTVLESAEADALFRDADTCTNPEGDYTVMYPNSWYTNTEVAGVSACSWFSPVYYELNEDGTRPEEVAIEIGVFSGAVGFIWADLYTEAIMLDGVEARRTETGMTKDPGTPTDQFVYSYLGRFGPDTTLGRKLSGSTTTEYGGEYELNKAVLDRIMASLVFTD